MQTSYERVSVVDLCQVEFLEREGWTYGPTVNDHLKCCFFLQCLRSTSLSPLLPWVREVRPIQFTEPHVGLLSKHLKDGEKPRSPEVLIMLLSSPSPLSVHRGHLPILDQVCSFLCQYANWNFLSVIAVSSKLSSMRQHVLQSLTGEKRGQPVILCVVILQWSS